MARFEIGASRKRREIKHVFADVRGIRRGRTTRKFGGNLAQPAQLSAELFDDEFDHPDGFMKTMAHFFFHRTQRFLFTGEFGLQEFLTPLELFAGRCPAKPARKAPSR